MFMKTGDLTVLSDDIDENKPLNTPSALAQHADLFGRSAVRAERQPKSRRHKRNVKNEGCSQWLIENKGPKKVLPMSS
jgi:hypothetical protein